LFLFQLYPGGRDCAQQGRRDTTKVVISTESPKDKDATNAADSIAFAKGHK
jgi:hypothetical protein